MIKIAILWDFDGVIIFTPHEEAWRLVGLRYGITDFSSDFYHKYVSGRPRYEGARAILEYFGLLRDLDSDSVSRIIHEFAEEKNKLYNELISRGYYSINTSALEFIESTKKYNNALFVHVLASASRNVAKLADNVSFRGRLLREFFDYNVSGSGDTKKEVFEKGLRLTSSADCHIVIDDAPSGIRAALDLGLIPIGFRNLDLVNNGAVYVIKSFKETSPGTVVRLCRSR